MWGVMGGGVGGSGAVGAVGAQEGADWYKMFRLCEGHTHFCPRTWKEEEVRGVAGEGEGERGEATDSAGLCGWDGRWASHSPEPQRRREEAPGPLPFGPRAS